MNWLYAAAGVLLLLVLLMCLRLRVRAVYNEDGFALTLGLGPVWLLHMPDKKGRQDQSGGQSKLFRSLADKLKRDRDNVSGKSEKTKGGGEDGFCALLPIITEMLGKLRRKLRIDEFTLWYQSACQDPADAAMAFGAASAAAGLLLRPLEGLFHTKKRDVRTSVSFTESKPTVYLRILLSLTVYQSLCILLRVKRQLGKRRKKSNTDTEEE